MPLIMYSSCGSKCIMFFHFFRFLLFSYVFFRFFRFLPFSSVCFCFLFFLWRFIIIFFVQYVSFWYLVWSCTGVNISYYSLILHRWKVTVILENIHPWSCIAAGIFGNWFGVCIDYCIIWWYLPVHILVNKSQFPSTPHICLFPFIF